MGLAFQAGQRLRCVGITKMSKLQRESSGLAGPLRGRGADFSPLQRPPLEGVDILPRARPANALGGRIIPSREDIEAD